ncbi:GNAT family N-acetyltransferase [Anaerosporobacter sp.]
MVQIIPVKNEEDYQLLLSVESLICKETPERWHQHFGGIGVDRYFFGDNNDEIFEYGKLIYLGNHTIGYALVYLEEGEYNVSLLSEWKEKIAEIIPLIEKMLHKGQSISTVCNDNLVKEQLIALGYVSQGEVTYSAVIDLDRYIPEVVLSRRAIQYGLGILKERGLKYVYVDTSADNEKAIGLYRSVGFIKCIDVIAYNKEIFTPNQ